MIVKAVTFFLIAMLILGLFGKLRFGGGRGRLGGKGRRMRRVGSETAKPPGKCARCGAYLVGRGPCPCGNRA